MTDRYLAQGASFIDPVTLKVTHGRTIGIPSRMNAHPTKNHTEKEDVSFLIIAREREGGTGPKNSGSSSAGMNDGPKEAAGERRRWPANVSGCSEDWFLEISWPFEQVVPAGHARARVEEIEGREPVIETDRSTREVSRETPCILFMSDHPLLNDRTAERPTCGPEITP